MCGTYVKLLARMIYMMKMTHPGTSGPTKFPSKANPGLLSLCSASLQSVNSRASAIMSNISSHSDGSSDDGWDSFLSDDVGDKDKLGLRTVLEQCLRVCVYMIE